MFSPAWLCKFIGHKQWETMIHHGWKRHLHRYNHCPRCGEVRDVGIINPKEFYDIELEEIESFSCNLKMNPLEVNNGHETV